MTIERMRRFVLAVLVVGSVGTAAELLLLEHDEDLLQIVPLALIALTLVLLGVHAAYPRPAVLRVFQLTMLLFIIAGATGVILHFRANMEFQLDIDASIASGELFWKVMRAKAPPALAPGIMAQLGLLGLIFAWRHPILDPSSHPSD